jgi:hypothetical protein
MAARVRQGCYPAPLFDFSSNISERPVWAMADFRPNGAGMSGDGGKRTFAAYTLLPVASRLNAMVGQEITKILRPEGYFSFGVTLGDHSGLNLLPSRIHS